MQPFRTLTALAAPLDRTNVDTDQIIPKQFLKRIERTGYGEFLFFDWRRTAAGDPDPAFVLERPALQRRANPNRRQELRLRLQPRARRLGALLTSASAPSSPPPSPTSSFPTPARTASCSLASAEEQVAQLLHNAKTIPNYQLTVSLEAQTVTDSQGFHATFEVDPFRKFCLIEGLDDIGLTLRHATALDAFEANTTSRLA